MKISMRTALLLMVCFGSAAIAQQPTPAARLLDQVAAAMGGRERLQHVDTLIYTGFGQDAYMDGGGNITADANSPPKWRAIADAQRSIDLKARRALLQQRRAPMFPFAAPFGLNWNRASSLQSGADLLDHPLTAVLAALDPAARLGAVSVEDGLPVLQFTTAEGTPVLMGVDPVTHLPSWTRRVVPHANLGEVAVTAYFTGYVSQDGVMLPYGLMTRIDWRNQVTLMFQVDSYRLNPAQGQMPAMPPAPAPAPPAATPAVTVTPLAKGVWDLRVGNNNGGPVIEFADHLVLFEANGSAAATLARIDAGNKLVPGKQITTLIVTHHHFDHTAGLRAAVSRGLAVISHRGNEAIFREMIARDAIVFPDELAKSPHPLVFTPIDERLVLEDKTQRLELYHVLAHSHMANAVFAYLPAARIMMEGDMGDAEWTWHWWANALNANIKAYGINPRLDVAVHGPNGGLSIEASLANNQRQVEAAQKFCAQQQASGVPVFGCPVQYDTVGAVPLSAH
ncbi:MAG TPA: MBL fold metallo-hydrolase [Steroidobacteraceae bacterium]|nr:MBL fold metallo-hydrolase [Steroidobacteraceae bacterium]